MNTQPEPKTFVPAVLNCSCNLSRPPKSLSDGGLQLAVGSRSAGRSHDLPEHGVIGVAAGVVAYRSCGSYPGPRRAWPAARSSGSSASLLWSFRAVFRLFT